MLFFARVRVFFGGGGDPHLVPANGDPTRHEEALRALKELGCPMGEVDKNGCTLAHHAAAGGHVRVLWVLLELGCTMTETDHNGLTPVHFAIQKGQIEALEVLKDMGCPVALRDSDGRSWTAAHWAAATGRVDTLRTLQDMGISMAEKDGSGRTAAFKKGGGALGVGRLQRPKERGSGRGEEFCQPQPNGGE